MTSPTLAPTSLPTVGLIGPVFTTKANFTALCLSKLAIIAVTILFQHIARWANAYFRENDMEQYVAVTYKLSQQLAILGLVLFISFVVMQSPVGKLFADYQWAVRVCAG